MPNFVEIAPTATEISFFSIFQRWRPPPPWILKCQIFNGGDGEEGRTTSPRQISLISAKTRPRYRYLSIFQDGYAVILDFKNFKFLTVGRVTSDELRHCAKFRRNRWKRGRDM